MSQIALGKTCFACGKERKIKNLRYVPETLLPYCENPYACGHEAHPNSPQNLIRNQMQTELITYQQASELHRQSLSESMDPDKAAAIHNLVTRPTTLRVPDPDMAEFLINRMGSNEELKTLSDAIRECIQIVMDNEGMMYRDQKVESFRKEAEKSNALHELSQPTKPIKPASDDLTF